MNENCDNKKNNGEETKKICIETINPLKTITEDDCFELNYNQDTFIDEVNEFLIKKITKNLDDFKVNIIVTCDLSINEDEVIKTLEKSLQYYCEHDKRIEDKENIKKDKNYFKIEKVGSDKNKNTYYVIYNCKRYIYEVLNNIEDYLGNCLSMSDDINRDSNSYELYYHGQDLSYDLSASIFRNKELLEHEKDLNSSVISRLPSNFPNYNSDLFNLVNLRHFSQPARLFDISYNPLIGLYFALASTSTSKLKSVYICFSEKDKEKYENDLDVIKLVCLTKLKTFSEKDGGFNRVQFMTKYKKILEKAYPITEQELNKIDENSLDQVFFVHTPLSNPRILQQQGAFLIVGRNQEHPENQNTKKLLKYFTPTIPIKDDVSDSKNLKLLDDKTIVYIINPEFEQTLLKHLDSLGYNKALIYPDLENIISYLVDRLSNNEN